MEKTKQELIDAFFEAYSNRDMNGIKQVMAENVTWHFLGQHKLAGIKNGIDEVISFFDKMGNIMGESKPNVEKLIIASNEKYLIECQHIKTNREDDINIEHDVCVLWTFENNMIISGKHFFADPKSVDTYFNAVPLHTDRLFGSTPIIIETTFQTSVGEVWKALTDLHEMKKWYFESLIAFIPEKGFETEFIEQSKGKNYLHKWKITEVENEKRITCLWKFEGYRGESLVTFELMKNNGATKFKLTQTGYDTFSKDNPEFSRESWVSGWSYFIQKRLSEYLSIKK